SAQKSTTIPIDSRKSLAKGALFRNPGALTTELAAEYPPICHHFCCTAGCANHLMYLSASSLWSEYETTDKPWPPNCVAWVFAAGFAKKPILSPPTFGSL